MMQTNLSNYSAKHYQPGSFLKRALWYVVGMVFISSAFPWPMMAKKSLLVIFGAKIGNGFVIKPRVRIKYPWFFGAGDYVWIGEDVWIDNLEKISIGDHVCISQGTYLTTGSHNYKKSTFDLLLQPIQIKNGAWIAAKCVINPGVVIGSHSVVAAGSVVTKNTADFMIYTGNPAKPLKERIVT